MDVAACYSERIAGHTEVMVNEIQTDRHNSYALEALLFRCPLAQIHVVGGGRKTKEDQ